MTEAPTSAGLPEDDGPPSPRRIIAGRYEVIAMLGQGSAARTFLCLDLQENSRVVVKELRFAHLSDWKQLDLFAREARMLAKLDHPGIPRVFDDFQGAGESATFHIVQEFIDAPSLMQRMEKGPLLSQKEIRQIALGLLDILDYLHGRAPPIIHRDIKPSNVLLRTDGTPALIDFGGVRALWQPGNADGATVVGTFGYMAPEQVAGHATPASDLYSVGATLLHLVTGHSPDTFPFDSGRIEVPANLPTEKPLATLIETLLRPAPRDRPLSAEAARELLTNPAARPPLQIKAHRPLPPSPAGSSGKAAVRTSGEPRFVEMGAPPRDPRGELRDVYRNLMHPLFPARRPWSGGEHAIWIGFAGLTSLATLGGAPAIYGLLYRRRRKQYEPLFANGAFTVGTIRAIPHTVASMYTLIKYEFEAEGVARFGFMQHPVEVARYWGAGDPVAVLYDPADPGESCIVYR